MHVSCHVTMGSHRVVLRHLGPKHHLIVLIRSFCSMLPRRTPLRKRDLDTWSSCLYPSATQRYILNPDPLLEPKYSLLSSSLHRPETMKLTTTIFAIAAVTTATALPSWRHEHKDKEIPSLSVQEWQGIQTGHFDGLKTESVKDQGWMSRISDLLSAPSISLLDEFSSIIPFLSIAPIEDPKDDKTIYAHLLQEPDKYSKIVKLLDLEETGKAKKVLDDKDESITFFAPGE